MKFVGCTSDRWWYHWKYAISILQSQQTCVGYTVCSESKRRKGIWMNRQPTVFHAAAERGRREHICSFMQKSWKKGGAWRPNLMCRTERRMYQFWALIASGVARNTLCSTQISLQPVLCCPAWLCEPLCNILIIFGLHYSDQIWIEFLLLVMN